MQITISLEDQTKQLLEQYMTVFTDAMAKVGQIIADKANSLDSTSIQAIQDHLGNLDTHLQQDDTRLSNLENQVGNNNTVIAETHEGLEALLNAALGQGQPGAVSTNSPEPTSSSGTTDSSTLAATSPDSTSTTTPSA